MLMILMVFTPWCFAKGSLEAKIYPSYLVFRDALSAQILVAQSKICVVTTQFADRELGLFLFGAAHRAVSVALRMNPIKRSEGTERLMSVAEEIRLLGVPLFELSLKPLKLTEPTYVAVDQRAWSIGAALVETPLSRAVEVEAAPWTSAEVCAWAQSAQSAKAATSR